MTTHVAWLAGVLCLAGFTRGLTGFGFALVAVNGLTLLVAPRQAVPLVMLHSAVQSLALVWALRRHVQLRRIIALTTSGACAVPVGAGLLATLGEQPLRVGVGLLTAGSALVLLSGWRYLGASERNLMLPVGTLSGLLGGALSMSGPPVIILLAHQDEPKDRFRANLAAHFLVLELTGLLALARIDLLSEELSRLGLLLLPATLIGTAVGSALAGRVPQVFFHRLTLGLLSASGLLTLASATLPR